jgi:A/G-specific adenine glycosylase
MPWKGEKDPYKIWLSEIILQQTRVEQGMDYYHRFVQNFPDIHRLASAPDVVVLKTWEGLGYYSRCRNLLITARYISAELNGIFPNTYDEINALKGIGPYTASAISSFAFNLPHAVVDGNVFRVLSRIFGISIAIDSSQGKKHFSELANTLLDKKQPAVYNQAIMDFGAVVCKPALPLCTSCIFNKTCYAFLNKKISELPFKEKKIRIRKRWFYYLVLQYKTEVAIRERTEKDIWQQLYEFPMIETDKEEDVSHILLSAEKTGLLPAGKYRLASVSPLFKQQLSHQLIVGKFIRIDLAYKNRMQLNWVTKTQLLQYAFPKFINQYLRNDTEQSMF